MAKASKKSKYAYLGLRFTIVSLFTVGFIYQTMEFLYFYWTYPTVVDIQQSSPTSLEIPAFTFCNRAGYRFENLCTKFSYKPCIKKRTAGKIIGEIICTQHPELCENGELPDKFKGIMYHKFMTRVSLTRDEIPLLAMSLEEYLKCTIEFGSRSTPCDIDNVLGSFYTPEDLPQICYTIFSKWGNPNKTRHKVLKGAVMKFSMQLNQLREDVPPEAYITGDFPPPPFNPPNDAAVQIAVHSPYFLPSPYFQGYKFIGGRNYELRIKLTESHLLPAPYQTNCTDYMKAWHERGGKAPINQLTTIQECRINVTYQKLGCIPVIMDYPHPYNICKSCDEEQHGECKWKEPDNNCTLLADSYNQPCDSMVYTVDKQDQVITIFEKVEIPENPDSPGDTVYAIKHTLTQQNCSGNWLFSPKCITVNITVPFDRFEITNYTYNPKFESLELFSVVGGYMGMWLGVSLLTVFDVLSDGVTMIREHFIKKKRKALREKRTKVRPVQKNPSKSSNIVETANGNVAWSWRDEMD